MYMLTTETITPLKELSITEPALLLAINKEHVCIGMESKYIILNWESSQTQDIIPCEDKSIQFIESVGSDEFLIRGPGHLGIFVKPPGVSERAPLQLGKHCIGVTYSHPYIIALSANKISIYR